MNSFCLNSHPLDYSVFDLSSWEWYFTYHFITCTTRYTCQSHINLGSYLKYWLATITRDLARELRRGEFWKLTLPLPFLSRIQPFRSNWICSIPLHQHRSCSVTFAKGIILMESVPQSLLLMSNSITWMVRGTIFIPIVMFLDIETMVMFFYDLLNTD